MGWVACSFFCEDRERGREGGGEREVSFVSSSLLLRRTLQIWEGKTYQVCESSSFGLDGLFES